MTKPKTAATLAALQRGARIAREAQRVKRASATARLLAEPMPAEFHALTCDCGATFVVGPRDAASGRVLRCSMCRAEAVRASMATVQCPSCRVLDRSFDWPCMWCRGARKISQETARRRLAA